jgi:hypothetical protein
MLSTFLLPRFHAIDKKVFNHNVQKENIYWKAMESFLFYQDKP